MRWLPLSIFSGLLAVFCWPAVYSLGQQEQRQPAVAIVDVNKSIPPGQNAQGEGSAFTTSIRPLLKTYCFECHGTAKRKAGLDLEKIDSDAAALDWPEVWDQVGERLRAKEMPPGKSKQPTEAERQKLMDFSKHIAELQVSCDKLTAEQLERALAGRARSRRLNRTEYNNTLRDLFGVDLHAGDLLPSEGGGGEGFDNSSATLFITPVLMEKYLEAAELVLGTILPAADAKDKSKSITKVEAAQLENVRHKLLVATPDQQMTPGDAARKVIGAFLPKAFRRPPAEKDVDRYLAIFDKAAKRGDSFDQSVKLALKAVLISPSFLLLIESPPAAKGAGSPPKDVLYRLDHYDVASHLSYFLWASMPDEELLQLAAQSKLHDEKVLRGQVQRMMRDPRSRGLADSFAAQWLGIRPLGESIRPDEKLFPEFNAELAAAMREETLLFFDAIIREDRSILEIIDANYTFVNEGLAALYKIKGIKGPQMRRVNLDDPFRGGVLGQASILTVTSYPNRTSPVLRGRWILDELLGADVPPPPPNIPVINDKDKAAKGLTFRQQLEKHRSKPECAGCHSRMDPLGFGMENFDPIGRWRTVQDGKPIDTLGVLPTGDKFNGPTELKKVLVEKRRPEFVRNLSRKMLGYALGREIKKMDMCVVQDCVNALEQGELRASRLLEAIVVSYPFSHRYQKAE